MRNIRVKRIISSIAIFLVALSLWADFDYRLELVSMKPLHREYLADPDKAALQFIYMDIYRGFPDHVFQDGRSWDGWEWNPTRFDFAEDSRMLTKGSWAGQVKLGENLSLLRNTFTFDHWLSPISFDYTFSGIIDILMEGAMADMIAYDGVYFHGLTLSIAERFSLRFGFHHICTHYGDGIMKAIPRSRPPFTDRSIRAEEPYIPRDDFNVTYKYVRMNGIVIGLSIEPVEWLRLYGEYNFVPVGVGSLRPVMFQPSWIDISNNPGYPESYRDQIINFGIELSYPIFPGLGNTRLGYDCHMYEEGRIRYRDQDGNYIGKDEMYFYDPDASWIVNHGLVLEQELNGSISIELGWHTGRSPLHTFWYMENPGWFHIGIRFNPEAGITLYDSAL